MNILSASDDNKSLLKLLNDIGAGKYEELGIGKKTLKHFKFCIENNWQIERVKILLYNILAIAGLTTCWVENEFRGVPYKLRFKRFFVWSSYLSSEGFANHLHDCKLAFGLRFDANYVISAEVNANKEVNKAMNGCGVYKDTLITFLRSSGRRAFKNVRSYPKSRFKFNYVSELPSCEHVTTGGYNCGSIDDIRVGFDFV